jgi:hypothetical protein
MMFVTWDIYNHYKVTACRILRALKMNLGLTLFFLKQSCDGPCTQRMKGVILDRSRNSSVGFEIQRMSLGQ